VHPELPTEVQYWKTPGGILKGQEILMLNWIIWGGRRGLSVVA